METITEFELFDLTPEEMEARAKTPEYKPLSEEHKAKIKKSIRKHYREKRKKNPQ